ncbi:tripartite tricarboxylate transporter permease [Acuticoccus sp. M5D2P5]|uniref:tripartite tricarboxylate transporter permease n=1 Tax=Acuticoccus kalidii TaxID=2910977 RepID=UPI001F442EA8|nr:tripartite tricarboxylate transporter permease [Acuticoccus kalidii]MCF3932681.1 tripartite tricarboxylate transporter permease [Acuticoccus kalidii]
MFNDILAALFEMLQPMTLLLMSLGVLGGLFVGAIPGFSATMAIVIILPLTYTLGTTAGLAVMIGVAIGGLSGGLLSAMLIGIPGTPASVATTFDGLPLVRAGHQGRAVGLGIWSSCVGGLISGVALVALAPFLGSIGLEIGPWGYFSMVLFALTITASLSGGAMVKGLIAGSLGVLAASVGEEQVNGVTRLTFGNDALDSGFDFLPILIGVFAFSQLLGDMPTRAVARRSLATGETAVSTRIPHLWALRELGRRWSTVLRSSAIGLFIGVIPATGASISNILAYDQARRNSKTPEAFGKGATEGIIAPETANNATQGGSLLVLMALGIPGDAVAAVLLAALIIHDVVPGPTFISDNPQIAYGIFVAFILSHLLMVVFQLVALKFFVRVVRIPVYILASVVLFYCALGVYAVNNVMYDVWVMIAFGAAGFAMSRLGYPIAPFVLGVVLGDIAEVNLIRAISIAPDPMMFVTRPWSLLFLALAALSVTLVVLTQAKATALVRSLVTLPLLMVVAWALFQMPGAVRPALGAAILAAAAWQLWRAVRRPADAAIPALSPIQSNIATNEADDR